MINDNGTNLTIFAAKSHLNFTSSSPFGTCVHMELGRKRRSAPMESEDLDWQKICKKSSSSLRATIFASTTSSSGRSASRPPLLPRPPPPTEEIVLSASNNNSNETGHNHNMRPRKRSRIAVPIISVANTGKDDGNREKILKQLADQALRVMRGKGMLTCKDGNNSTGSTAHISPPLSPRSFYRKIGFFEQDDDSAVGIKNGANPENPQPTLPVLANTPPKLPTPPLRLPAVPLTKPAVSKRMPLATLPLKNNGEDAANSAKTPTRSNTQKSKQSDGITPARVQAARCLLSFSQ